MHFYFNNNDLAQYQLKRFAEQYYSPTMINGGNAVRSGVETIAHCQMEIWGLANRRARAVLAFPSELASCTTPNSFVSAYANFWKTAFAEYADTTHRVSKSLAPQVEVADGPESGEHSSAVSTLARSDERRRLNGVGTTHVDEYRHAS